MPLDLDHAAVVNLGDRLVGAGVLGPTCDVLDPTVRKDRLDEERLDRPGFEAHGVRVDPQGSDLGIAGGRRGRTGGDPFGDHAIFQRLGPKANAAAVFDRGGSFQKEKAFGRRGWNDTASQCLAGQNEVVDLGSIPAETEPESVFAGRGTVAGPLVAAGLGQYRLDVVAEAPGLVAIEVFHGDRGADRFVADLGRDDCRAVGDRCRVALRIDLHHTGAVAPEGRLAGQVAHPGSALHSADHEPLA